MKTKAKKLLATVACILFGYSMPPTVYAQSTVVLSRPVKGFFDPGPLPSANNNIAAASLADVPLEIFTLTSRGGSNKVTKVKVAIPPGVVRPKSLRMARKTLTGLTDIGTRTMTSGIQEYEFLMPGIQGDVLQNKTYTYVLRGSYDTAAFGLNLPEGEYSRVQIVSVKFLPAAGGAEQIMIPSPAFYTPEQRFYRATANWSLLSPATIEKTVESGMTTRMTVTFPLKAVVSGADIAAPKASDFVIIGCIGREAFPCAVSGLTIQPSEARLSDGSISDLTVKAELPLQGGGLADRSGMVTFRIVQINWATEGQDSFEVEQSWGLEAISAYATEPLKGSLPPTNMVEARVPLISHKLYGEITSVKEPDGYGFVGQLVGEGKAIHIVPTQPNGLRRVVFPQFTAARAQMMQIDVDMSLDDMVPHIIAPSDIAADSRDTMVEFPLENVVKETENGHVRSVRFEIVLGGLRMYGLAERTGNRSSLVRFRWEPGKSLSTSGSIGETLDLLDLSGSLPPVAPATGMALPQRFPFGMYTGIKTGAKFILYEVESLPEAMIVEASENLVDWLPINGYALERMAPNSANAAWRGDVVIDLDTLPAGLLGKPTMFFRMKVRN